MGEARIGPLAVNMDREWNAVSRLAGILRTLPAGQVLPRTQAWGRLIRLTLDKEARVAGPSPMSEFSLAELESFFRDELLVVLKDDARRLARKQPQVYPDDNEIESNWRNFAAAFGKPA
jgi:hypothetical protein